MTTMPTTFTLATPVTVGGTEYTTLEARTPKGKDLRLLVNADKDPIGAQSKFLASVCGVPHFVFEDMEVPDLKQFQKWMKDFLSDEQT